AAGTTNSDIQVQFDDDAVKVKIDRFREFHEEFEMRFPGRGVSLDGTAELPEDASVDPDNADATLAENGTLRVRIPKDEDDGPVDVAEETDEEAGEEDDGPESIELDDHEEEDADDHGDEAAEDDGPESIELDDHDDETDADAEEHADEVDEGHEAEADDDHDGDDHDDQN
ncbi:MAG: Hsp20/alpha crystallin family, partial [halophilic archaeon J07HB67]